MLNLMKREILQSLHDPRRILFLFGAGVAYLIVFGILYQPNIITNIPCAILDEDNSKISREFIDDIDASDTFNVVDYVATEEEMHELLKNKKVLTVIEIPKNFNRDIKTGKSSNVLLIVNGSNIINTSTATSAIQDIAEDFSNRLAIHGTALRTGIDEQRLEKIISPVKTSLRILGNPTQGYLNFLLIGLAFVAFQQGIIFAVGAAVLYEYEHKTDIPLRKLIFVKMFYYWILATLSFAVIQTLIEKFCGIKLLASNHRILFFGAIFCLAVVTFAILLASLFETELKFLRAAIMIPVPTFILTGYTWPTEAMPTMLQYVAKIIPLTWFANPIRELFLLGDSPKYFMSITGLFIMSAIYFMVAIHIFRKGSSK